MDGYKALTDEKPVPWKEANETVHQRDELVPRQVLVAGQELGVRLAHAMNPKPLKRAFAVFLTLVALNMLRKVLGW